MAPHQPLARLRATAPSVTASPQAATSIPRKGEDLGFLPRPPSESRRPATPARHRPGAPAGRAARHAGPRRWGVLLPERGLPRGTLPEQGPGLRKLMRCQEVPGSQARGRRGPRGVGCRGRKHRLSPQVAWTQDSARELGSRLAMQQEPAQRPPGPAREQTGPATGCALPDSSVTRCPLADVGLHPQTRRWATTGSGGKQPVPIRPPLLRSSPQAWPGLGARRLGRWAGQSCGHCTARLGRSR